MKHRGNYQLKGKCIARLKWENVVSSADVNLFQKCSSGGMLLCWVLFWFFLIELQKWSKVWKIYLVVRNPLTLLCYDTWSQEKKFLISPWILWRHKIRYSAASSTHLRYDSADPWFGRFCITWNLLSAVHVFQNTYGTQQVMQQ